MSQRPKAEDMKTGRRAFLNSMGAGLASVVWSAANARQLTANTVSHPNGTPNFAPRAKSVIWLFMRGGFSHVESFDPKPMLTKYAGKSINETPWSNVQDPERLKKVRVVVVNDANGQQRNVLLPLQVGYRPRGESGIEVSDWFPHIGGHIDDLAVVR